MASPADGVGCSGWCRQLCELVDQLHRMGHHHSLVAKLCFKFAKDDASGIDFTAILPWFREKGIVTVIDDTHGRIFHSSTCSQ